MGCTCSEASQPSGPPTLLEHRHQSALPKAKPTHSLESWELQLLQVSSELKMKLKDPHYVAKRCDLDSSGDLDMHELKQASRAFGIKFSTEELEEKMAGEDPRDDAAGSDDTRRAERARYLVKDLVHLGELSAARQALTAGPLARINKERFAQIVADAPVTSAERSRPTIPHSLRGMALGQLQQLESIFITSGWLSKKCNAFNLKYADAIREGKKFPQAANLYAMNTFVVTPMSQPGKCDARRQDSAKVVPEANEKMSFSEVVNPNGLIVHCFVSHFWGHLFSQTVTALQRWAEMNCERIGAESSKSMVYWICLFALNQHAVADEVGENPMQGPFNAALAQAEGGAVMVLDEEINPFKRIWCLFEISRLKELNQPFELICEMGSLSKPESLAVQQTDPTAATRLLQATCEALWQVSAWKAKASVKEDQIRIWEEIANPCYRKLLKNVGIAAVTGAENPDEQMFGEFDQFSQGLLSSALLQFCLMHNDYAAAAKCCEKGACFTKEQFAQINTHVREEDRTSWLSNLLLINTNDHRLDTVGLLLQSGVCMEAVESSLRCAAQNGHEAVTKLLLENGANVAAANKEGWTALTVAAKCGHEAVTKLLLDHGADVAAGNKESFTALMAAALGGHETVTQLLLDRGADVAAADINGKTALMCAVLGGHEEVTKLLLDNGANVAAANKHGWTALMVAAIGGHEEVTMVLLENGADVAAANKEGSTALMAAAKGGHEAVKELLWERDPSNPRSRYCEVVEDNNVRSPILL